MNGPSGRSDCSIAYACPLVSISRNGCSQRLAPHRLYRAHEQRVRIGAGTWAGVDNDARASETIASQIVVDIIGALLEESRATFAGCDHRVLVPLRSCLEYTGERENGSVSRCGGSGPRCAREAVRRIVSASRVSSCWRPADTVRRTAVTPAVSAGVPDPLCPLGRVALRARSLSLLLMCDSVIGPASATAAVAATKYVQLRRTGGTAVGWPAENAAGRVGDAVSRWGRSCRDRRPGAG